MLKGYNLFGTHNVVPYVQTLQLTLFECICKHFNVVHDNEIIRYVQIS
jgi:hypothetical protein